MALAKTILIFLVIFALTPKPAAASGLFEGDSILQLDLKYDMRTFSGDKGDERGYHPAKLSYADEAGNTVTLDVQLRVRGRLRRQMLKCLVPPYKIKFDKAQVEGTLFEGQKKLKLVTHCKNRPAFYEQYTLMEYLIYKVYNMLSIQSFRVRLARITYYDTKKKVKTSSKYAFFLESYSHMVERNKGESVSVETILLPQANFDTSTLVSVFEYMIGNTDWSIRSSHNVRLMLIEGEKKYIPVPFDFDQAGLIDAHYARPDLSLPIRSVRERLFRGFCNNVGQFDRTFTLFRMKKEKIISLYENFMPLSKKLRKRSIKYIKKFYDIIDSPKLVNRYFIENYRGRPFPKR